MSLNIKSPMKSLSATAIAFLLVATPDLGAQILQPGLQPGLARAPDSARKISLDGAIALAQQNSPQAIQAEGTERTSKAARVSAIGAILPSATLSAGHVVQIGGGTTRLNQNGEQVTVAQRPTNTTGLSLNMTLFDGGQRLYGLRTANADIAAAEANRVAVKYNVALNVKQQYYAVLAAIESYDAAKLQMQQAEAQFASMTGNAERRTERGAFPQALVDHEIRPVVAPQRRDLLARQVGEQGVVEAASGSLTVHRAGGIADDIVLDVIDHRAQNAIDVIFGLETEVAVDHAIKGLLQFVVHPFPFGWISVYNET